jgi:hypothetical protein
MIIFHLQLDVDRMSAFETLNGSMSTYSIENVGISALLLRDTENSSVSASISESSPLIGRNFSGPPLSIEIQFSGLTSVLDVSAAKFHKLRITYKDVFSDLNWQEH